MKNLGYFFAKLFIKLFGNVQFFTHPLFLLLWGDSHYKIKGPEMRAVMDTIKSGDIILRRYDRYVSGWFIPGFWTHVGIVSNKKEVIHASVNGVVEEDILTYLRADHVMVLRPENGMKKAVFMAREFIGKEYDFIFETIDDERLYCTELIKRCYAESIDLGEDIPAIPPDRLMDVGLEVVHDSEFFRKNRG